MKHKYLALFGCFILASCGGDEGILQQTNVTGAEVVSGKDKYDFVYDFTLYPGAEVQSHMTVAGQTMALFKSKESADTLIEFYRDQALAQGFSITLDRTADEDPFFNARRDDGARTDVTVTDEGDHRLVDLVIGS
ncbi:hypothetical protein [Litorimonas haliclonae]|uniref:hypothetical protein n=1 Tax=Litorimonas haliclonae TaxID=2081977 RepID=UPI0039F02B66